MEGVYILVRPHFKYLKVIFFIKNIYKKWNIKWNEEI